MSSDMRINNITLRECMEIPKQTRRPYRPHLDSDILGDIEELIDTDNSFSNFDVSLSSVAGRVIVPSTENDKVNVLGIDDWDDRRWSFSIEIILQEASRNNRNIEKMVITGYTDGAEIYDESIEDTTKFYIDGIYLLAGRVTENRYGDVVETYRLFEDDAVLAKDSSDVMTGFNNDYEVSLTSSSIFGAATALQADGDIDYDASVITDASIALYGQTTDRRLIGASGYLGHLLSSDYAASRDLLDEGYDEYLSLDTARNRLAGEISNKRNRGLRQNRFIKYLCNEYDNDISNVFQYSDLEIFADNDRDELERLTHVRPGIENDEYMESDNLCSAKGEAIAAYMVAQLIPHIAKRSLLEQVTFVVDNLDYDGRVQFALEDFRTYVKDSYGVEAELSQDSLDAFEDKIIREVFDTISERGRHVVSLRVECDIYNFTRVEYTDDSGETFPFVFASFAQSVLSPVISSHKLDLRDLCDGYIGYDDENGKHHDGIRDILDAVVSRRESNSYNTRNRNSGLDYDY